MLVMRCRAPVVYKLLLRVKFVFLVVEASVAETTLIRDINQYG